MAEKKLTRKEKIDQQSIQEPDAADTLKPPKRNKVSKGKSGAWLNFNRKLALIVAAFAMLIYVNSINHGYILDDASVLTDNFVVKKGIKGIPTIFQTSYRYGYWNSSDEIYRPLILAMYALEWEFFPDTPAVYHFINVLVYAISGYFLFLVLCALFRQYNVAIPFVISLLFVSHPIHTEVVANIKSRDEILCLLLVLISLVFTFKYIDKTKIYYLAIAAVVYMLSLSSKESSITFLAVVPLMLYVFTSLKRFEIGLVTGFYAAGAGAYLLVRRLVLGSLDGGKTIVDLDNVLAGAANKSDELATAIMILGKYFMLLVLPHPLVCDYSIGEISIVSWSNIYATLSLFLYVGLGVYAIIMLKQKNLFAFGILLFLITISVFSNVILMIGSSFGERFMYMPSLGFVTVVGLLIAKFTLPSWEAVNYKSIGDMLKANMKLFGVVGIILLAYSFKTVTKRWWTL